MRLISIPFRILIFFAYYICGEVFVRGKIYSPPTAEDQITDWNKFFYNWGWIFALLVLTEITWKAFKRKKPAFTVEENKPHKAADVVIGRPTVEKEKND